MFDGGDVTNGSAIDRTALISGNTGVQIDGSTGGFFNSGTIVGAYRSAVGFYSTRYVTNGSGADTGATLDGATYGVTLGGFANDLLTNYGTIVGNGYKKGGVRFDLYGKVNNSVTIKGIDFGAAGIFAAQGGRVINGDGNDRTALIEGNEEAVLCR
jgi:hypothetical protein